MATNIVLKRSSSSGAVPGTSDLALGEIALNTYDGKMYMKKTVSGSSSIVELTGSVALSSSAFDLINYKFVATSNQTSFSGSDANSVTLAYATGTIQVFLNGILLDPTDYTATNGTAVVLDTGANSGDILYISRFAGVNPFDDFKYVASSNQTTFTGSDANSETLLYTVGNLAVYLNGVQLDPTDYTATNGTSVVLASAASSGDILHIHEFNQTGLTEVHSDTTPQLGGDLDVVTYDIVSTDNRNIDIIPHGTGDVNLSTDTVKIGASGEDVIVTTNGTGDITLSTNAGTNSGLVKILDGANQNIEITPNGSGKINLDGLLWPNADGSANQFIQTDGSGNLSFVDVLDTAEEIADTVGAMVGSNTETGITVTYQDSDNTLDFALDAAQTGITSLGTLTALDVDNLNLNGNTLTSASSDFIIDASHDIILDADGGDIYLKDGGTTYGQFTKNGGNLRIYNPISDGDINIIGNDGGSDITAVEFDMSNAGDATFNSHILLKDGKKIKVGNSQDLEIYHSGSHSHIHDVGTGNFYLDSNGTGIYLTYNANNENMAQFVANGAVTLYHDNSAKIATAAAGITVTGEVAATSLDISGDVDVDGTLEADAITVNGTALSSVIAGTTLTQAAQTNITSLGTLTTLTVDDITINGSTISDSGDLTLDVGGDLIIDVDGTDIILKDGGTNWGLLANNSSDFVIRSAISDQDLLLQGNDGGSTITALTLDMSDAGKATFNSSVAVTTHARGTLTTDNDGSFDMNASNNFKCTPSGNFTLTFTNISAQSGNILLINSGGHTVSAHANTKVDANILGTISTAGTYLLAYFSDGTNAYMTNSAVYS